MPNIIEIHEARFGNFAIRYFVRDGTPYLRELSRLRGPMFFLALAHDALAWLPGDDGGADVFVNLAWLVEHTDEPMASKLAEIRRRLLEVHAATVRSPSGQATVEFPKFSPAP